MAAISRSWHVPDETWQSVEISHRIAFGYGYQTWEWRLPQPIRSYAHPLIFVPGLYLLKVMGWDSPQMVVLLPRITQAVISAVGDVCLVNFFVSNFGNRFGLLNARHNAGSLY